MADSLSSAPESREDSVEQGSPRRASEHHLDFHATVERAPVGIGHFATDGRFLFVNAQLCAILGLSRETLLARTFQSITFPDDLPRCLEVTAQLATGAIQKYTLDKRFNRPDGTLVYTRVIASAARDARGAVSYYIGIVEDLSEQWAIEEGRRGAEDRLRLALDASRTGIYRYDFRTLSLDWTNNLGSVFGFPDGDALRSLDQLLATIHPDDLPAVVAAYQKSAEEAIDFNQDFRIVRPDGSVRWISDRARMTVDANGAPVYLTGACVDITALRESEAERETILARERQARLEAEQGATLRDEVMAIVAHDLRNPVHTIVMSSAAMLELDLGEEARRQQVAVIRRSAYAMEHLIRDLLDVTRIESGRLTVDRKPVSVAPLLAEMCDAFDRQARDLGVALELEVAPEVQEILADRDRVSQVLSNLIGNALKFTAREGRVALRARPLEGFVELSVSDTGKGIPAADLPRVFDRFWQADRGAKQGVGLGLAIVRGIVDAHGGRTEAESTLGKGSTFRFSLPAAHPSGGVASI
jgi:PAS domain S-box-containing protein